MARRRKSPRTIAPPARQQAPQQPATEIGASKADTRRDLFILAAVVLGCLLPFAAKPVHVDDPLFIWSAQQIRRDPIDYFGCLVNWNGYLEPLADVTKNPPLACYLLAGWSLLVGWSEIGLHVAFTLQAVAAAWGSYYLARRFCRRPLWAALMAISTPAFVVCGTTLMGDMLLLAFWCWAIEFWWRGLDDGRTRNFIVAGLCLAAAALSKYFGLALIPLLTFLTLTHPSRRIRSAAWLLVPLAIVAAYELYSQARYGSRPVFDAVFFATSIQLRGGGESLWEQWTGAVVYAGGCFVTALCFAPLMWSKRALLAIVATTALFTATIVAVGHFRSLPIRNGAILDWNAVIHIFVFALAGVHIAAMLIAECARKPTAEVVLLGLWLFGTWLFAAGINWAISARALLPAAPAIGILVARQLAFTRQTPQRRVTELSLIGALTACAFVLSLLVAWGDYRTAATFRELAEEVGGKYGDPQSPPRFQGHWGFQYYLEAKGAKAEDYTVDQYQRGARLIVPRLGNLRSPNDREAARIDTIHAPYDSLIATLSSELQGFIYGNAALPFRVIEQPPAECSVFEFR